MKWLAWLIVGLVLSLTSVNALQIIEDANYKISCYPDMSTFQSVGHTSYCSVVSKGLIAAKKDLFYCFGSSLKDSSLKSGIDYKDVVTNKYSSLKGLDKSNCYAVEGVNLLPGVKNNLKINFESNPLDSKFDLYVGDFKTGAYSLVLDPFFNNTLYEIGTNRTTDYNWNNGIDLSNYTSNLHALNITNSGQLLYNMTINLTKGFVEGYRFNETTSTDSAASILGTYDIPAVLSLVHSNTNGKWERARGNFSITSYFRSDVTTPTNMTFNGTKNYTISLWFNSTVLADYTWLYNARAIASPSPGDCLVDISIVGDNVTFQLSNAGVGNANIVSYIPVTVGNWHHVVAMVNSSSLSLWYDGVHVGSTFYSIADCTHTKMVRIGRWPDGDGSDVRVLNGSIDELYYWNRALNVSEIQTLTSGNQYSFYPFPLPPLTVSGNTSKNFTYYSSKNITMPIYTNTLNIFAYYVGNLSLNVSLNGNTSNWTTVDFGVVPGSINGTNKSVVFTTPIEQNNKLNYRALLYGLDTTVYNMSFELLANNGFITGFVYDLVRGIGNPLMINLSLTNLLGGQNYSTNITGQNVIINGSLSIYPYEYAVHFSNYSVYASRTDSYVNCTDELIVVEEAGYPFCYNVPFHDARLNITIFNGSGVQLQDVTVRLLWNNATVSYSKNQTTTSGLLQFNLSRSLNYSLVLTSPGFSVYNRTHYQVNRDMLLNLTFLPSNSVNISVYNTANGLLINDSVLVTFTASDVQYNFTFTGGSTFVTNLLDRYYRVDVNSVGFSQSTYYLSITNTSSQSLNAYLTSSNLTAIIGVFVKQTNEDPISNASVLVKQQINGTFVTVNQGLTDVTGYVLFYLDEGTVYEWTITAAGYSPRVFYLIPYLANAPYTFKLSSGGPSPYFNVLSGVNYYYRPTNQTLVSGIISFNFTTLAINNDLLYTAIRFNHSQSLVNVSGSPSGSSVGVTVNLNGYNGVYPITYIFSVDGVGNNNTFSFTVPYYVSNVTPYNTSLIKVADQFRNDLSGVWQSIVAIFVIAMGVVTAVQLSGNPVVGTIVGFMGMIVFAVLGWISVTTTVFMVVIGLVMLFYTRGGY